MGGYLYDLELTGDCRHLGALEECILTDDIDLDVLRVFRGRDSENTSPGSDLQEGDVLRTRGSQKEVGRLSRRDRLLIRPPRTWRDSDLTAGRKFLWKCPLHRIPV